LLTAEPAVQMTATLFFEKPSLGVGVESGGKQWYSYPPQGYWPKTGCEKSRKRPKRMKLPPAAILVITAFVSIDPHHPAPALHHFTRVDHQWVDPLERQQGWAASKRAARSVVARGWLLGVVVMVVLGERQASEQRVLSTTTTPQCSASGDHEGCTKSSWMRRKERARTRAHERERERERGVDLEHITRWQPKTRKQQACTRPQKEDERWKLARQFAAKRRRRGK
jgi:hypothetical protein